ncbi:hypothetical protein M9458_017963, partial [Cirrhinus mrigala]
MDHLACREYLPLLLEQGERSLEGHTRLFLVLASLTSYLDDSLCAFYNASLTTTCRAPELRHLCGVDTGEKHISVPHPWA